MALHFEKKTFLKLKKWFFSFGFDQIPAECIVESLGDREKVQEEFINSHLIQDSQNSNSSIPVDVSNHVNNGGKSNGNGNK